MLRTGRAVSLASATLALISFSLMLGCSVQQQKDGSKEKVSIQTPVGGINVNTNAEAKDTGIAVYPGAKQSPSKDDDHNSANVNISSSMFGVKVIAVEYVSEDSPDKIKDYYKKELAKFGNVLDCPNGAKEEGEGDQLVCSDKPKHVGHHNNELVVGTKQRRHIVSIEPNGKGTKFGLVYVQVRGEEGML